MFYTLRLGYRLVDASAKRKHILNTSGEVFSGLLGTTGERLLALGCSRRWPPRKVVETCPNIFQFVSSFSGLINKIFTSAGSEKTLLMRLVLSLHLFHRATRWKLSSQSTTSSNSRPENIGGWRWRTADEAVEHQATPLRKVDESGVSGPRQED